MSKSKKRAADVTVAEEPVRRFVLVYVTHVEKHKCDDPDEDPATCEPELWKIPTEKLSKEELGELEDFNMSEALASQVWLDLQARLCGGYGHDSDEDPATREGFRKAQTEYLDGLGSFLTEYRIRWRFHQQRKAPIVGKNDVITHTFFIDA